MGPSAGRSLAPPRPAQGPPGHPWVVVNCLGADREAGHGRGAGPRFRFSVDGSAWSVEPRCGAVDGAHGAAAGALPFRRTKHSPQPGPGGKGGSLFESRHPPPFPPPLFSRPPKFSNPSFSNSRFLGELLAVKAPEKHFWPLEGEITSQRLLDQSQAGVYRGKRHLPPPFWPFWAYSRTLPQGVELLV